MYVVSVWDLESKSLHSIGGAVQGGYPIEKGWGDLSVTIHLSYNDMRGLSIRLWD